MIASRRLRILSIATACAATVLLALLAAGEARAMIYWADGGTGRIGRANLDGSGANPNFITAPQWAERVAVNGTHIYWTDLDGNSIGRANLDGSGVITNFITPAAEPIALTLTSTHVYWTGLTGNVMARASLDGSDVNLSFMSNIGESSGIAVRGDMVHWVRDFSSIARSRLNGTWYSPNAYPSVTSAPWDLYIHGDNIFWTNASGGTIHRVGLEGESPANLNVAGAGFPAGLAVQGDFLYWADDAHKTIGRVRVDGSNSDPAFVGSPTDPRGVAVDWIRRADGNIKVGKLNKRRLTIDNPGPGRITVTGKGLSRVVVNARGPNTRVQLKPKKALKRKIKRQGKVSVKVKVSFAPALGSGSTSRTKKLTLR